MRKPLQVMVAILMLTLAGRAAWQALGDREPVYQGKRLSSWLESDDGSAQAEQEAQRAVVHAGTNAVPTLLRMLREDDSPLKRKVMELAQKQQFVSMHFTPAEVRNDAAWVGFSALGSNAVSAVPALMQICDLKISWQSEVSTVRSLAAIGPPAKVALPVLLRATTNSHFLVRAEAVHALVRIGAEPELVLPALTNALADSNSTVRQVACVSLAEVGEGAKQAVPVLVKTLGDPIRDVQYHAARALRAIDPQALARAGVQ